MNSHYQGHKTNTQIPSIKSALIKTVVFCAIKGNNSKQNERKIDNVFYNDLPFP